MAPQNMPIFKIWHVKRHIFKIYATLKYSNHRITWFKKHDIANWNIGDYVLLINLLCIGQDIS